MAGPEDFEDYADAVNGVYARVVIRKTAVAMLASLLYFAVTFGDWGLALAAFTIAPDWLAAVIMCWLAAEGWVTAARISRSVMQRRAARRDPGQDAAGRYEAAIDRYRERRRKNGKRKPALARGPLHREFWGWVAVRVFYSGVSGWFLAAVAGSWAAGAAVSCQVAASVWCSLRLGPALDESMKAAAFADVRPPRDTPET